MFDLNAVNLEFTAFKYIVFRRDPVRRIAGFSPPAVPSPHIPRPSNHVQPAKPACCLRLCLPLCLREGNVDLADVLQQGVDAAALVGKQQARA